VVNFVILVFAGVYVLIAWIAVFTSLRTTALLKDCMWLNCFGDVLTAFRISIEVGYDRSQ